MAFKPANSENVFNVLHLLEDYLDEQTNDDLNYFCDHWLNPMLQEIYEADWFGTEGQLDPRGDHRD